MKSISAASQVSTFRRGLPATIFGLAHLVIGFIAIVSGIIRIYLFGPAEVFRLGTVLAVYNYIFEAKELLLWFSGVGLLRGKHWGLILMRSWAGMTLFMNIVSHFIRRSYWGELAPPPGWGETLLYIYVLGILIHAVYAPLKARAPAILKKGLQIIGREKFTIFISNLRNRSAASTNSPDTAE